MSQTEIEYEDDEDDGTEANSLQNVAVHSPGNVPHTPGQKTEKTGRLVAKYQEPEGCLSKLVRLVITFCVMLFVCICPCALCWCFAVVKEYQRVVIFRMGRLRSGGARGPGTFFVLPCLDEYHVMDLRTVSFDVPPQEVLSKDSVTVAVDAVVYYRVWDPITAVANVKDYSSSTKFLAATTLRNVLGTKLLSEILADREQISHLMQEMLDEATDPWGVKVERVEMKDVKLPVQLQRAMAAEAEATREAKAKVIAADGEYRASIALKKAADVMEESPGALQLRYLQTLTTIAAEKNSTIIFPLPLDILRPFMSNNTSTKPAPKREKKVEFQFERFEVPKEEKKPEFQFQQYELPKPEKKSEFQFQQNEQPNPENKVENQQSDDPKSEPEKTEEPKQEPENKPKPVPSRRLQRTKSKKSRKAKWSFGESRYNPDPDSMI